jgi:hypothetical protein
MIKARQSSKLAAPGIIHTNSLLYMVASLIGFGARQDLEFVAMFS